MLKFKSRKEFNAKLAELDSVKAAYYVDMVVMHIWDIMIPTS
jgi:hypothetical protein